MTERLYYDDCYLTRFEGAIVDVRARGLEVVLDRTAFYPPSGGQPHDLGRLGGRSVIRVSEAEDGAIVHHLDEPLAGDGTVEGEIDWLRRFDLMQQHTGQHLLSAVCAEEHGLQTVSVHMGEESSTVDLAGPAPSPDTLVRIEERVNQRITENLPVHIGYEDAGAAKGLRKASDRSGILRIVTIEGADRSACGGTHVRATGEIGALLLRRSEKIRDTTRIEFLCGLRAIRRSRKDADALLSAARVFSAAVDEVPGLVAAQREAALLAEKARMKLAVSLAELKGRALWESTPTDATGIRRCLQELPIDEEARALASSFTAKGKALFVAVSESPPVILFAVSPDTGLHAGKEFKAAVASHGGRGGGSGTQAQGSLPDARAARAAADSLIAVSVQS